MRITVHLGKINVTEWDLVQRNSSSTRLIRITAWLQNYVRKLRARVTARRQKAPLSDLKMTPINAEEYSELTPSQLQAALLFWIVHVQKIYFAGERKLVKEDKELPRANPFYRLAPVMDEHDSLRVGGRLRHSILDPYEKHPWILPQESPLSRLLVHNAHHRTLYGGTQLTLSFLRQRVRIVNGRRLTKSVIFQCLKCWKLSSKPTTQRMGDLPLNRVRPSRPFLHSGTDYAGPINVRFSAGRGTKSYKGYVVIFICQATRAVHLEAASDYSTKEFLNFYRRFVARRGICATLSSDCGTNYIRGDRELRQLFNDASLKDLTHHLACLYYNLYIYIYFRRYADFRVMPTRPWILICRGYKFNQSSKFFFK